MAVPTGWTFYSSGGHANNGSGSGKNHHGGSMQNGGSCGGVSPEMQMQDAAEDGSGLGTGSTVYPAAGGLQGAPGHADGLGAAHHDAMMLSPRRECVSSYVGTKHADDVHMSATTPELQQQQHHHHQQLQQGHGSNGMGHSAGGHPGTAGASPHGHQAAGHGGGPWPEAQPTNHNRAQQQHQYPADSGCSGGRGGGGDTPGVSGGSGGPHRSPGHSGPHNSAQHLDGHAHATAHQGDADGLSSSTNTNTTTGTHGKGHGAAVGGELAGLSGASGGGPGSDVGRSNSHGPVKASRRSRSTGPSAFKPYHYVQQQRALAAAAAASGANGPQSLASPTHQRHARAPNAHSQLLTHTPQLANTRRPRSCALLVRATAGLVAVYRSANDSYRYSQDGNPRRVLTKPSVGVKNDGYDNESSDLIMHVNDVLVNGQPGAVLRRYAVQEMLGQGTFGQVVSCWCEELGASVAVKVIKNQPAYYHQVGCCAMLRSSLGAGEVSVLMSGQPTTTKWVSLRQSFGSQRSVAGPRSTTKAWYRSVGLLLAPTSSPCCLCQPRNTTW